MDPNIVNHPVYGATISNDLRSIPSLMHRVGPQRALEFLDRHLSEPHQHRHRVGTRRVARIDSAATATRSLPRPRKFEMHGNASRDNVRTPKHSMRLGFNSDYGPTKLRLRLVWRRRGRRTMASCCARAASWMAGRGATRTTRLYTSSETGETFRGLRYRPENTCYLRDVVDEGFLPRTWAGPPAAAPSCISTSTAFTGGSTNRPSISMPPTLQLHLRRRRGRVGRAWWAKTTTARPCWWTARSRIGTICSAWSTPASPARRPTRPSRNRVDIDNLIDYMMLHIFAESEDWPRHNWYVAHRRATNGVAGNEIHLLRLGPGTHAGPAGAPQSRSTSATARMARANSTARLASTRSCRNWPEFRRPLRRSRSEASLQWRRAHAEQQCGALPRAGRRHQQCRRRRIRALGRCPKNRRARRTDRHRRNLHSR